MRTRYLLPLLLLVPSLTGCGVVARQVVQKVAESSNRSSGQTDATYVQSLQPILDQKGLLVFEPVADASARGLEPWGAGASRFLQFHAGGQMELGRSPMWGVPENLRRRFELDDLALEAAKARELGEVADVSHVAVGRLSGGPERATLVYELHNVDSEEIVAREELSGSVAQINTKLPDLARRLASKLGVSSPKVPSANALSVGDLESIGRRAYKPAFTDSLSPGEQEQMLELARKDALGGITAGRWHWQISDNATQSQSLTNGLLQQAPGNAYAWAESSYREAVTLDKHAPLLAKIQKSHPDNSLLALAGMWRDGVRAQWTPAIAHAEKQARVLPDQAMSWVWLAGTLFDASDAIRRSRVAAAISSSEWEQITPLYQKSHAAALRATEVDPDESMAWKQLALSANFNGDRSEALSALEKSLELDPNNGEAWGWGMQMMQPKWGGSNDGFFEFATRAAQHADSFHFPAREIVANEFHDTHRAQVKPILEVVVAKNPRNAEALSELGQFYHYNDRTYNKAEKMYRQALAINPNDARTNSALGDLTFFVHNDPVGAERLYRRAIHVDSSDGWMWANLGRALAAQNLTSKAVAAANKAKSLGYNDPSHQVWAMTGVKP